VSRRSLGERERSKQDILRKSERSQQPIHMINGHLQQEQVKVGAKSKGKVSVLICTYVVYLRSTYGYMFQSQIQRINDQ
jgi:hypothetical protein